MADEADETLNDSRGWRRPPQTMPGAFKGRRPPNAGRKWPTEILTPQEVQALIATTGRTEEIGRRDRAMMWLMYRLGVRPMQLVSMSSAHYTYGADRITIPATRRYPETTVPIDPVTRGYLDEWIEDRRKFRFRPTVPLFCSVGHPAGRPIRQDYIRGLVTSRGLSAGVEKRVTANGVRLSGIEHAQRRVLSVESQIEAYVDEVTFAARYPVAYRKWHDALDLFTVNADRHATRIGHDCREALMDFVTALAVRNDVKLTGRPEKTIARLRAVIASKGDFSPSVAAQLEALMAYFGTVSDLGQRQEHGAAREKESLTADDARRVVFYSMLVMYELDRTLGG